MAKHKTKAAKRLEARIKGYEEVPVNRRGGYKRPGSLKKVQ